MVKGPLTVTDMICWHAGMGMGLYGVKPLRLGYQNRTAHPALLPPRRPQNVPDVMQRVHWDPEFARRSGNPTTFDYGRMRETWLIHLCTDWMGDDAWLWKLDCEFRKFNYVGDTQWLRGRVVRKYLADGDRPAVDLELEAVNQRGEVDDAGPRDDPAAEPRARRGAPARSARRRARPAGRARRDLRGVLAPMTDVAGDRPTGSRSRSTTRRAAPRRSTGPRSATRSTTSMMARPHRRARRAAGDRRARARDRARRRAATTSAAAPTSSPATRDRRAAAARRQHPAPAADAGAPADPAAVRRCRCRSCARCAAGPPGIGFQLALAADFTIAADDATLLGAVRASAASPPTAARRGCCRAASARSAPRELLLLGRELSGAEAADVGRDPPRGARRRARRRGRRARRRSSRQGPTVALGLTKWLLHAGRGASLEQQLAQRGVRARAVVAHRRLPRGARRVPRARAAALRGPMSDRPTRARDRRATRATPTRSPRCARGSTRNVPRAWIDAGRAGGAGRGPRGAHRAPTYEAWYPVFAASGLVVPTWPVAYGGLDLAPAAARRVEQELRAVQPRPAQPARPQPRRARAVRARHRGAAAALPAADRAQRRGVVPAVQRARRGLRPRVARDPRRARRRPLDRDRPEGVDHVGAPRRLRRAARPHRSRRRRSAQGITYFLLDLHQPGVDVRPLRHIGGEVDFNEVFLDGAVVPDDAARRRRSATAGRSRTRRSPASGRWCRARARAASIASAGAASTTCSSSRADRGVGTRPGRAPGADARCLSEERIRDWTNQRVRAAGEGRPLARARRARSARCTRAASTSGSSSLAVDLLGAGRDGVGRRRRSAAARGARHAAQPRQHDRGRHHRGQQEHRRRARARPAARARSVPARAVARDRRS